MSSVNNRQVAIIGSGPAGISAAIQLKRFGISPLLFASDESGSLLKNAWRVDNYLGSSGVAGKKLLDKFESQLKKFGVKKINSSVVEVDYKDCVEQFDIKTKSKTYQVDYLIVASGTKPKLLFDQLDQDISDMVYYESFPLFKKRNKTIAIVGAGDAAFDYSLSLSKSNKIFIYNGTKNIKASQVLAREVSHSKNIEYYVSCKLCDISKYGDYKKT